MCRVCESITAITERASALNVNPEGHGGFFAASLDAPGFAREGDDEVMSSMRAFFALFGFTDHELQALRNYFEHITARTLMAVIAEGVPMSDALFGVQSQTFLQGLYMHHILATVSPHDDTAEAE